MFSGAVEVLRRVPPLARDGAIVVVLIVAGLLHQLGAPHPEHEVPAYANQLVHAAVIAGAILPLLLRRRFPFLTLMLISTVIGAAGSIGPLLAYDPSPAGAFGLYFAIFTAVAAGGRARAWLALAIGLLAITLVVRPWITPAAAWLPNYFLPSVAFVAGFVERRRRELTRVLQRRIVDEPARRERSTQLRLQEVKAGLAKDVHEVVVTALRRMNAAAREALRRLGPPAHAPERALREAEDAGRSVVSELRLLLAALGGRDSAAGPAPTDLHGLEERVRQAVPSSVNVRVSVDKTAARVAPSVAVAACGLVQDGLMVTDPGTRGAVEVTVRLDGGALVVHVHDERRPGALDAGRRAAVALTIRERLSLAGATLETRRSAGGGWSMLARLPLGEPGDVLQPVPSAPSESRSRDAVRAMLRRVASWGWPVDVLLVAVFATGAVLELQIWEQTLGPGIPPEVFSTGAYLWALGWVALLLLRRLAPVVTGVAMAVMAFLQTYPFGFWTPVSDIVALQVAVYTIGSRMPGRPHAWVAAVVGAIGIVSIPPPPVTLSTIGFLMIMAVTLGGAAYVGTIVGERRRLNAELEQHLHALAEERRTELALALRRERLALAREMHDLVAHSVTLMVVQAGAARTVAATDPEAARRAVATVIDTGERAADELDQLLTMLGTTGAEPSPPATARDVHELVREAQRSGLDVELESTGDHAPSRGSSLELSAYRIVQEALTNARKHAPGSHVRVRLRFDSGAVTVRIENDDSTAATADAGALGAGRGLAGMHERVAMFGGRLEAGPRPTGGFVVEALMPLDSVAT